MLPDLSAELRAAAPLPEAPITGPRRWWGGALDVEGLALASVASAASAAAALTGRGLGVRADLVCGAFGSFSHTRVGGRAPEAFSPLSGFFPAADGWLRTHANYPHHAAVLERLFGARDADGLRRALAGVPAAEAEADIVAAGGVAARVRTAEEWRRSEPGRAAASGPPLALFDATGDALVSGAAADGAGPGARSAADDDERPGAARPPRSREAAGSSPAARGLAGLRVLDLTRVIAGPTATGLLAALGADVLRVDPPSRPELLDAHIDRNAGKRTALLDLRRPGDRRAFDELVAQADAVVLGYRPGGLDALGAGSEALREARPRLVVAEFSAWGFHGPWAQRRGFDSIVQAATGIADLYRHEDGRPGALPVQALDYATGFVVAAAVCALLARRGATGRGGLARASLARTAHTLLGLPAASEPLAPVPAPVIRSVGSPYGPLELVAPAVADGGAALGLPGPPDDYGTAAPRFLPRGGAAPR
ncbi:CoA transferase [Microbacterium halophytorum]|uniref:CoA transferase n=1 Tax=Microbacterium halophytorum TaxID=2067568 RepID=UPI001E2BF284|nr:CoA transferase [Microbacterium halophytorum]